mgnify:CR=1 FL=1
MTQRPTDDTEPLVLLAEAAVILGVSKDTVKRNSKNGKIPFVQYGGPLSPRRYDPAVLRRMRAEAQRHVPTSGAA